jgi:hypothetical protein
MSRKVFMCLFVRVSVHDDYFTMKKDVVGKFDFSSLRKGSDAIRMLAYIWSSY